MTRLDTSELVFPRDVTITKLLLEWNPYSMSSDKPAIVEGVTGEVAYTHSSFRLGVKKLAIYLRREFHIRSTTTVCILMRNSIHYALLVHSILACGATVSALNPDYQVEDLAHALTLALPSLVLVDKKLEKQLKTALGKRKSKVVLYEDLDFFRIVAEVDASQWEPLAWSEHEIATRVAFLCFSSGTTGTVKGVRLSHRNIVANMFQHREALQRDFDLSSVFVLVLPYFHILGIGIFVCQYILQGFPTVVFPKFDFAGMLRAISRDKVTHINVVPALALEFLRNPIAAQGDYTSVRCLMNAAAPLKQDISDQICSRLNCVITQWYGMTEASPSVISQSQSDVHVQNSIGKLLPGMELRILDGDDQDCPEGTAGELCIRGPNIMLGYVGPTELTQDAMTADGFMRTGDIGYINRESYVFLVDRAKEMIKVKGNQVAPAELEGILLTHPSVKDAAVRGYYVERDATEYPVGFIKMIETRVAHYKRLSGGIYVLAEIPRKDHFGLSFPLPPPLDIADDELTLYKCIRKDSPP